MASKAYNWQMSGNGLSKDITSDRVYPVLGGADSLDEVYRCFIKAGITKVNING